MSESLSKEEILKIAKLARLTLTDAEVELYRVRLSRVIGYVNELAEVKTDEAELPAFVPRDAIAFRDDAAVKFVNAKHLLENAPMLEGNCFALPAIMEDT